MLWNLAAVKLWNHGTKKPNTKKPKLKKTINETTKPQKPINRENVGSKGPPQLFKRLLPEVPYIHSYRFRIRRLTCCLYKSRKCRCSWILGCVKCSPLIFGIQNLPFCPSSSQQPFNSCYSIIRYVNLQVFNFRLNSEIHTMKSRGRKTQTAGIPHVA